MASINLRGIRSIELPEVFEQPPEPTRETLCTYLDGDDKIVVESKTFTVVLNRDIRHNVRISSEMSLWLARKFPEKKVVLINTYAGTDLLQKSLAVGMWRLNIKLPPGFKQYVPHSDPSDFDEAAPPPFPTNLRLLDCPTSTFSAWRLEEELKSQEAEIVILNSFEFSTMSLTNRRHLAEGLIDLRARRNLSIVLFSHEMKNDVASFTPGRGAIGYLTAYAGSVWRIMTPFDRARWNKQMAVGGSSPAVHENKINSTKSTYPERNVQQPAAERKFFL